jgi:glycosyltransferase involved in cell wall biosynthesis
MSEHQPLFTVATITYNSGKWVRQAIESVLASSFTDFEFLISDDCSTDDTWTIIQQYKDPRIRVWRNEKNIGEYPNRNKVLNEAKGKYVLYIDGDDILYKDSLSEYSKFANAFPGAAGIWGVYPVYFDFVAFPYLFKPDQLTALNFLSTYPVTAVGFAESVFGVKELKQLGGFDERFAIGDTYMKRKFSCFYNVLLVTAGHAFWRQYPEQASNKVRSFYRNLIETYTIDKELLYSEFIPIKGKELETAKLNFRIRSVKLIILNTIRKGRIPDFFKLMNKLSIPYSDILLIFKKGDYSYKAGGSSASPLMNDYHFK